MATAISVVLAHSTMARMSIVSLVLLVLRPVTELQCVFLRRSLVPMDSMSLMVIPIRVNYARTPTRIATAARAWTTAGTAPRALTPTTSGQGRART